MLEGQIQELVKRVVEGQGLPWPKPAGLKKLASHEKTRVMVLRQLEVELAVRNPDDLRMATSPQIAVVVSGRHNSVHYACVYMCVCVCLCVIYGWF